MWIVIQLHPFSGDLLNGRKDQKEETRKPEEE
jgi:hypothetical protein